MYLSFYNVGSDAVDEWIWSRLFQSGFKVNTDLQSGKKWTNNIVFNTIFTVEEILDFKTPAGLFNNCIKINIVLYDLQWVRCYCYTLILCKDIGIIYLDGLSNTLNMGIKWVLNSYSIKGTQNDYFPLYLNNKWEYNIIEYY